MRPLREQEQPLLRFLFDQAGLNPDLSALRVDPMSDGGMGSLRFGPPEPGRRLGHTSPGCEFFDSDGVLVSAELNFDQKGELFELDVWKVDFSPLQRWSLADDLRPAT